MARAALVAHKQLANGNVPDPLFYQGKRDTARFYADHILPQATALAETVVAGADVTISFATEALAAGC
jgi:hypothetical protein